jgi:hypothetical protein
VYSVVLACDHLPALHMCSLHFHKKNIPAHRNGNRSQHETPLSCHLTLINHITEADLNLQGPRFQLRLVCVVAIVGWTGSLCPYSTTARVNMSKQTAHRLSAPNSRLQCHIPSPKYLRRGGISSGHYPESCRQLRVIMSSMRSLPPNSVVT